MENFKKMLLVEPDLIEKLQNHSTIENPLSRLDNEMQKILNTKLDDREKWILYLQTLQRYLHFIGVNRQPYQVPIIDNSELRDNIVQDINSEQDGNQVITKQSTHTEVVTPNPKKEDLLLESKCSPSPKTKQLLLETTYTPSHLLRLIPKSYLKKGELLLETILQNKDVIDWENNGTVLINKTAIPGSNIVDLISDVLRPIKKLDNPIGWEAFSSALKEIKAPLTCVGNPKRYNFINKLHIKDIKEKKDSPVKLLNLNTPVSSKTGVRDRSRRKLDWEKWTPY